MDNKDNKKNYNMNNIMLYFGGFSGSLMFCPVYKGALDVHLVYVLFVCFLVVFYSLEKEFGWFLTQKGRLICRFFRRFKIMIAPCG